MVALKVVNDYLRMKNLSPLSHDGGFEAQNFLCVSPDPYSVDFFFAERPNTYSLKDDWDTRFLLRAGALTLHLRVVVVTDGVCVTVSSVPVSRDRARTAELRQLFHGFRAPQVSKPLSKKARKRGKVAR